LTEVVHVDVYVNVHVHVDGRATRLECYPLPFVSQRGGSPAWGPAGCTSEEPE